MKAWQVALLSAAVTIFVIVLLILGTMAFIKHQTTGLYF